MNPKSKHERSYRRPANRALKLFAAIVLLILGVAGLILPVLQGFLFIIAGLLLLADVVPSVAARLRHLEDSDPRIAHISEVARRNIDRAFDKPWLVWVILVIAVAMTVWGVYLLVF